MPTTRLARLLAAVALTAAIAGCGAGGGQGPTLPDVERTPTGDDPTLDERPAEDGTTGTTPGQRSIDEPDDPQPATDY